MTLHLSNPSRSHRKTLRCAGIAGMLTLALVAAPLMGGCSSDSSSDSSSSSSSSSTSASSTASSTSATSDSSSNTSSTISTTTTAETQQTQDASTSSSSDDNPYASFTYSQSLTDEGLWEGVDASDYVTLCDWEGIEVPADEVNPTDEEVQQQVDGILQSYVTATQVTDRAVEDGDTVNIDYVGTIDGEEFDGGSTKGNGTTVTIGVTQYIDNFLDQLVGHTPGETFDVYVTFPDDYGVDNLNGKDAVFSVTINYISEQQTPDLTDDWVNETFGSVYGWTTVDEMREALRTSLLNNALRTYVEDYIVDNSTYASELPQSMIDYQAGSLVAYYQSYADAFGTDLVSILPQLAGVNSIDELVAANQDNIDEAVKRCLALQAIAQQANITVTDDEVSSYVASVMGSAGADLSSLSDSYGMAYLRFCTLQDKVVSYIVDSAAIIGDDGQSESAGEDTAEATESEDENDKNVNAETDAAQDASQDGSGSQDDDVITRALDSLSPASTEND